MPLVAAAYLAFAGGLLVGFAGAGADGAGLHPAAGATGTIVSFASGLRHADLSDEVRHYARRHLLDTVGVMIAGAPGDVATNAEAMLAGVRGGGHIPVPGRARESSFPDATADPAPTR